MTTFLMLYFVILNFQSNQLKPVENKKNKFLILNLFVDLSLRLRSTGMFQWKHRALL